MGTLNPAGAFSGGGASSPAASFNAEHVNFPCDAIPDIAIDLAGDAALKSIYTFNWTTDNTITASLDASGCTSLERLRLEGMSALETLDLHGCTELSSINIDGAVNITALNIANCTSLIGNPTIVPGAALETLDASNCAGLTQINASMNALTSITLTGCTGIGVLALQGNSSLLAIDVSDLAALYELNVSNTGISALDLSANPLLQILTATDLGIAALDVSDHSALAVLHVGSCPALLDLDASGCALPEGEVDGVLDALDVAAGEDGTVDLSGGTNAPPSAAGLVSKAALQVKGWTVTVNLV
jgi:hypothetical protein